MHTPHALHTPLASIWKKLRSLLLSVAHPPTMRPTWSEFKACCARLLSVPWPDWCDVCHGGGGWDKDDPGTGSEECVCVRAHREHVVSIRVVARSHR